MTIDAHTIRTDNKNTVWFDDVPIGTVTFVRRNLYDATSTDGTVTVTNCYANGGAKDSAGYHLASRMGLLGKGMEIMIGKAGPYTCGPRS